MQEESQLSDMKDNSGRNGYHLTYKYLIAASLAALTISTFASWFFYSRWNEAEDRYTAQLTETNQISQTYNLMKSSLDEAVSDLSHIRDENALCIQLAGTDSTKHSNVRVFYNPINGETFVHVILLPNPLPGFVYHLWSKNGKEDPLDGGVIDFSSINMQHMRSNGMTTGWAVTLEGLGVTPIQPSENLVAKSQNW